MYGAEGSALADAAEESVYVKGSEANIGAEDWSTSDLEGVVVASRKYLLGSSHGDPTFHVYEIRLGNKYLGGFSMDGVGDTDGLDVVTERVGAGFERGLLVVHSGKAKVPSDAAEEIYGYELDGATQFELVRWEAVEQALGL